MKKFRLLLWVFAAMLAGTQTSVAQNWKGNDPANITSGKDVYLWNVGTRQFLYCGGYWGTQAITFDTGTPFKITTPQNGDDAGWQKVNKVNIGDQWRPNYIDVYNCSLQGPFQSGGADGYLGLTDGTNYSSTHDKGIWFVDRNTKLAGSGYGENGTTKDLLTLHLTAVDGKTNTYNIYCEPGFRSSYRGEDVYLVASGNNGNVGISTGDVSSNTNAEWMLITIDDVRANFRNGTTEAAYASTLDASYILYDQNFMRNNADLKYWYTGDITSNPTTSLSYSGFTYPGIDENGMLSPSANTANYYVGNGYDPDNTNWNGYYTDDKKTALKEGESHPKLYGAYFTANIRGNGTIWQKVRVPVEYTGWYIITCDGLTTKTTGTVQLFAATYSDDALTKQITKVVSPFTTVTGTADAPETYTEAGQLLFTNRNYGKQVFIYINSDNSDPYLVLGVEATGVNTDSWTCVDNFQIRYAGNSEDLILDEDRTDIDYINAQVDANKSYTMRLKRDLVENKWNSIILPVSLKAVQVRGLFGNNVKLSEKKAEVSSNPNVIEFQSIDLSDKTEEIVLKAGVPYIVKPTRLIPTQPAADGDTYVIRGTNDGTGTPLTVTYKTPYYTLPQVTLADKVTDDIVTSSPYDCGNADQMYFKGTYTKQTKADGGEAPKAGSYLLSDGKWYHMTVDVNTVKGFRTWLEPVNGPSNVNVQFSIDGVIDGDTTNSIVGIENDINSKANNKVYNMNGQLVRNGSTSLEGLPKGVYIVNNKKYIVK